jgi:hypothetical protein
MSRPLNRLTARALLALMPLFVAAGCGDDDPKSQPTPDTSDAVDTFVPDTDEDTKPLPDTMPDTVEPDVAPRPNSFAYANDMVGSNGSACTTSCAMKRQTGQGLDLAIVYKDADGRPIVDRAVYWDTGNAPTDLASLGAFSTFTDEQGRAQVSLRSGGLTGSLTVTAQVMGDDTVTPRTFTVTYEAPPHPDLVVSFEYLGQRPVAEFTLRLFEQEAGQSCATIHPDAAPAIADLTVGPAPVGQQIRVQTLPNLATDPDGQQTWIVQVLGPHSADGQSPPLAPLAVGCVDNIVATRGTSAQAMVYILDLPPHFRGSFQSVTRIDSLSGGEGTVIGDTLITLTQVFTQPGTLLVTWACGGNPTGVLGTVCYWITNSSGQPNFVGSIIVDAANAALLALLSDALGETTQNAAQIISEMLRDLRLVNTTTFANEPATPRQGFDGAYFAAGDAREEWTHVRFRWKFDPRCKDSPNPADCGWDQVPLEQVYGLRPTAQLEAGVDAELSLHVTPHAVPQLTYGPLVNFLVEKRIMPLVFAGGGTEPVDSWDDFVATLFGDRICLDYDDCCEYFASKLEDSTAGMIVGYDGLVLACEAAIPIVAGVIRNQLTRLDGALHLGTFSDQPCASRDSNNDRWIDGYGTQSNLCLWDLWFPASGQRFEPDNDWLSVRQ